MIQGEKRNPETEGDRARDMVEGQSIVLMQYSITNNCQSVQVAWTCKIWKQYEEHQYRDGYVYGYGHGSSFYVRVWICPMNHGGRRKE
jgi:hypothetical protein